MEKKKPKYGIKKLISDLHLWLGIGSGVILFLVCASGTLLTYETEIQEFFEPEKYFLQFQENKTVLKLDSLIVKCEGELNSKINSLIIRSDPERTYLINLKDQNASKRDRGKSYHINPYTGEVISEQGVGKVSRFIHGLEEFHRYLLMGKVGKIIVGISTIIFIILLFSGLYLWWPKNKKQLKNALRIKKGTGWKRFNYDLHNVLGFYTLFILFIMAVTGLNWSFEWYRKAMSEILDDDVFKVRFEGPIKLETTDNKKSGITYQEMFKTLESKFQYSGDYRISFPRDSVSSVLFRKKETGFLKFDAPDKAHINPHSGDIIKIERLSDLSFGEQINAVMRPLHIGSVLGGFSKILYFISCLIATSLPVTGIIIWINKLKKK